jgi:hypothetical protein
MNKDIIRTEIIEGKTSKENNEKRENKKTEGKRVGEIKKYNTIKMTEVKEGMKKARFR